MVRRHLNLKQRELADRLDMDEGSLRRIESGRTNPTLRTLRAVAEALRIPLYVFFLPAPDFEAWFRAHESKLDKSPI